jgi:hypothetical protein
MTDRPGTPESAGHGSVSHQPIHDVSLRTLKWCIVGYFALLILAMLAMGGLFLWMESSKAEEAPETSIFAADRILAPEPRLQVSTLDDLARLREKEEQILDSYRWVDKEAGIVGIPIDRAKELLLERGLPVKTDAP